MQQTLVILSFAGLTDWLASITKSGASLQSTSKSGLLHHLQHDESAITSGRNWRAWTPSDPAWPATSADMSCEWTELRSWVATPNASLDSDARKPTLPVCLRKGDHISDVVSRRGRWNDCYRYVELWLLLDGPASVRKSYSSPENTGTRFVSHFAEGATGPGGLFLEAGANIGSCTLELLLLTNASVVAFEPSPINLFYLTRSLKAAARRSPGLADRVVVFPIGLGDEHAAGKLFAASNNLGNSVITAASSSKIDEVVAASQDPEDLRCRALKSGTSGRIKTPGLGRVAQLNGNLIDQDPAVKDASLRDALCNHTVLPAQDVNVLPLDTIFPNGLRRLRQMKLDVQGFECKVLGGGERLLTSAKSPHLSVITSEVAANWLVAQCCGVRWLKHAMTPEGMWRTCTRKHGTDFTCVSRRKPSTWPISSPWPPTMLTGGERTEPLMQLPANQQSNLKEGMAWCRKNPMEHKKMLKRRSARRAEKEERRIKSEAKQQRAGGGGGLGRVVEQAASSARFFSRASSSAAIDRPRLMAALTNAIAALQAVVHQLNGTTFAEDDDAPAEQQHSRKNHQRRRRHQQGKASSSAAAALKPEIAKKMARAAERKRHQLRWWGAGIGDTGCASLGERLEADGSWTLTTILLGTNELGDGCMRTIGDLASHGKLKSLKTLGLSRNSITDDGCEALAKSFTSLPLLRDLYLSSNPALGDRCALALANAFATSTTSIEHISLHSLPKLTVGGVKGLLEALKSKEKAKLSLEDNSHLCADESSARLLAKSAVLKGLKC